MNRLRKTVASTLTNLACLPQVQAEKLDQFMREVQVQEQVFGRGCTASRKQQRDDAASKAMYEMKSVSTAAFKARA